MSPAGQVEVSSVLPLPAARVWARVTTPEGIRHELRPWRLRAWAGAPDVAH